MAQLEKMMDDIKGMTVLELNELVKAIEDEFGVSAAAAAPVMMAGAVPGAAGGEQAEEQTEFDVVLNSIGDKPSARSPRLVSRRPRSWSRARLPKSRKASTRQRPKRSRRSSKRPAPKWRSSNAQYAFDFWLSRATN